MERAEWKGLQMAPRRGSKPANRVEGTRQRRVWPVNLPRRAAMAEDWMRETRDDLGPDAAVRRVTLSAKRGGFVEQAMREAGRSGLTAEVGYE